MQKIWGVSESMGGLGEILSSYRLSQVRVRLSGTQRRERAQKGSYFGFVGGGGGGGGDPAQGKKCGGRE